jgi:hypothetical protein
VAELVADELVADESVAKGTKLELRVLRLVEFNGTPCTDDICCNGLLSLAATRIASTPVTFTLLCDIKLGSLLHENLEVILFWPSLILAYVGVKV